LLADVSANRASAAELIRSLRALHLLLRSARLYEPAAPSLLQSLDGAYESLRSVVAYRNGLEIRVERSGIVVPKLSEAPLPDARGDLYTLAKDLQSTGILHPNFRAQIPCRRNWTPWRNLPKHRYRNQGNLQATSAGLVAG